MNDNVSTKLLLVMSINDIGLAALRLAGIMCLYDWLETTHLCEFTFLHSLWEITALLRYITLAIASTIGMLRSAGLFNIQEIVSSTMPCQAC